MTTTTPGRFIVIESYLPDEPTSFDSMEMAYDYASSLVNEMTDDGWRVAAAEHRRWLMTDDDTRHATIEIRDTKETR